MGLCVPILHALGESQYCLRCILSNITERKHSVSLFASFAPSPLNLSPCWRCSWREHRMSWEEVRGQEKQSAVMTTWWHFPKNSGVAGGNVGKVNLSQLCEDSNNWIDNKHKINISVELMPAISGQIFGQRSPDAIPQNVAFASTICKCTYLVD